MNKLLKVIIIFNFKDKIQNLEKINDNIFETYV